MIGLSTVSVNVSMAGGKIKGLHKSFRREQGSPRIDAACPGVLWAESEHCGKRPFMNRNQVWEKEPPSRNTSGQRKEVW
ncbi:MAG: hypothetical protein DRH20_01360 [Deltaproteobacteria bacterium]|nr:MAG: hypothetical protein DRH20_01360 [Deltaproteobacteria bacterium]